MSTNKSKKNIDPNSKATGHEGSNIPDDLYLPPCTVEDVDRAVFNLFNSELPMSYNQHQKAKKIPVIFATGERFAVLRRKRPLRDKAGALILPLISIMRTGIAQDSTQGARPGAGQGGPITIRKKLSSDDPSYQSIINKAGLKNQDNVAHKQNFIDPDNKSGVEPGKVATRRNSLLRSQSHRAGKLIDLQDISNNIFEVVTMPPVKFYEATYEITFWAQYTQQMNDMLMGVLSSYVNNHKRTFRLETDKGYWFNAYVGSDLQPGNNYDDFTDDERVVKYSFEMVVPAYVIAPDHLGSSVPLRKFISAPQISFEASSSTETLFSPIKSGAPSGNPDSYILKDFFVEGSPIPGDGIGSSAVASTLNAAGYPQYGASVAISDSRAINNNSPNGYSTESSSTTVGGHTANPAGDIVIKVTKDPFTGKDKKTMVRVKSKNQRKGETVLRSLKY